MTTARVWPISDQIVTSAKHPGRSGPATERSLSVTFTALAADTQRQVIGVATTSYSLAVGNAVTALDPAVGAVASQAWTNRLLRARAYELLLDQVPPAQIVEAIGAADPGFGYRQLAVMNLHGEVAVHTGRDVTGAAGHRSGPGWAVLGNYLVDASVLEAMHRTILEPPRGEHDLSRSVTEPEHLDVSGRTSGGLDPAPVVDLALRLLDTLHAGQAAGGDQRGRLSAGLVVAQMYQDRIWPAEIDIDLRVDESADPLHRLEELLLSRVMGPRAARPPGWRDGVGARLGERLGRPVRARTE